jgi:rhodanese-related sulfurtransferase
MHKIIINGFVMIFMVAILSACFSQGNKDKEPEEASIKTITTEEAYNAIKDNKDNDNFVILDIRTPGEYATGHLENSVPIDFYSDTFAEDLNKLDKTKTYLVYCRSGNRSTNSLKVFSKLGFSRVLNMAGGIRGWLAADYPVVQ